MKITAASGFGLSAILVLSLILFKLNIGLALSWWLIFSIPLIHLFVLVVVTLLKLKFEK